MSSGMQYCDKPDVVVILAAGLGSRLKTRDPLPKPLMPILGRPLLMRVVERFHEAGVHEAVMVLGHRGEEIRRAVEAENLPGRIRFVNNPKYELSNGLSVLAAQDVVGARSFFLSMSDHIFEAALIEGLADARVPRGGLRLAVDRKLDTIYDMDDATKVRTDKERIVEIGKMLEGYDAIDSGLFYCSSELFDAIREKSLSRPDGDCSLSEGVETLSSNGLGLVHDIGDALWQDVDTPGSFEHAEKLFG